ncbi:hypothetical protein HZC20_03420 [Candidatus Peregrinibacteria bacterium]|nr:hypothetical protein [Candidatus Peregrinibacteria bacterium]
MTMGSEARLGDDAREFPFNKEAAINEIVDDCLSAIRGLLHGHLFSRFFRKQAEGLLEGFEVKLQTYGLEKKDIGVIAERVFRRIREVIR